MYVYICIWQKKQFQFISKGAVSIGEQSSGHKHAVGRKLVDIFAHTINIQNEPEEGIAISLSLTQGRFATPMVLGH